MLLAFGPPCMALEHITVDEFAGRCVGGFQNYGRRKSGIQRLNPAAETQTPAVTRLESEKLELDTWRYQVIAHRFAVNQEILGHHGANGMHAAIIHRSVAAPVTEKTGHRIHRTRLQVATEHIFRHT